LLVRTARTLAALSDDEQGWIRRFNPHLQMSDIASLLNRHPLPIDPEPTVKSVAEQQLRDHVTALDQLAAEDRAEAVAGYHGTGGGYHGTGDEEESVSHAADLQRVLTQLAYDSDSRTVLQKALDLTLRNPYPRYRDIMLVAIGLADVAISYCDAASSAWARKRMRDILRTGLDAEGVTFTFDLPAILLEEAHQRSIPAPELQEFLDIALSQGDRWDTQLRAQSARAAARF